MLSLRNVTKEYSMKDSFVIALDDVSVDFPEKGMVFLLGKSGSGKSTLLNISGGLDKPDKGEIILDGKSSKDFTDEDYDSYRNTFVGFVFQEYNVLDEFTVKENIALALELQNKNYDEKKINEILRLVDLEGLGDRKPNTLSGGQKQRVAIARALVKNPEIIMADEPTGALDSVTGTQVFDTLKKLSKDKLIIIVSHDREFAETYADRIIELKDGKIIGDRLREEQDFVEEKKENLTLVDSDTLSIRCGGKLTEEDIERINDFLKKNDGEIMITSDKKLLSYGCGDNSGKRRVSSFKESRPDLADVRRDGKVEFIKSKLPLKHAARIGVAGIREKPLRLTFTVLLSVIAFIIFGMFSTLLTYSRSDAVAVAIKKENYPALSLYKNAGFDFYSPNKEFSCSDLKVYFYDDTIKEMNSRNENYNFVGVFNYNTQGSTITIAHNLVGNNDNAYFSATYIYGFSNIAEDVLDDYSIKIIAGEYPADEYSVLIPEYYAEMFIDYNLIDSEDGKNYTIQTYDDLIGKNISLRVRGDTNVNRDQSVKISGVFDCGGIPEKYDVLRKTSTGLDYNVEGYTRAQLSMLTEMFSDYRANSFNGIFLVNEGFYSMAKLALANSIATESVESQILSRISKQFSWWNKPDYEIMTSEEFDERGGKDYVSANNKSIVVLDYQDEEGPRYEMAISALRNNNKSTLEDFYKLSSETFEGNVSYSPRWIKINNSVDNTKDLIDTMIAYFAAGGIVLAGFAGLLLGNFIAVSIKNKEKDIGILRAIGARGTDIFKIFFIESVVIASCCMILGVAGCTIICSIMNAVLINKAVANTSVFIFVFADSLIIFAVAFLSAALATLIPVIKAVKKKPVDVIRSL